MVKTDQDFEHRWACEQIEIYTVVYPRYANFAVTLQNILEKASKQTAPAGFACQPGAGVR
jgi:hypothetical protein